MNRPPRVLFCANTFETISNGPAKFANLLFNYGEKNRDKIDLFVLTADVTEQRVANNNHIIKLKRNNSFLHKRMFSVVRMLSYSNAIKRLTIEYNFDLVVFSSAVSGVLYTLACFQKVVVWGFISDDQYLRRNNFLPLNKYFNIKRILFQQFEKLAARKMSLVISNSKFITNLISEEYGVEKSNIYCLYKAVNLDQIVFNKLHSIGLPIKVLFVKSDFMKGGVEILVSALNRLPKHVFELTIIGPSAQNSTLRQIVLKANSNIEVKLIGHQTQEMVFKYLANSHIFCVPSNTEALGVANMEALACGVPVIATNVGGVPEVLDDGKCGWLVNSGDDEKLSSAINECIENDSLREKKRSYGRDFVVSRFNKERMLLEVQALVDSLDR